MLGTAHESPLYIRPHVNTELSGGLQVSVLTDQVDAQGEKIRDLDVCLEDNRDKLNSTEEMLQQVWMLSVFTVWVWGKTSPG